MRSPLRDQNSAAVYLYAFFAAISIFDAAASEQLPSHDQLRSALLKAVAQDNGGLALHMWATIVDRDGVVRAVVHSGKNRGDQWPGSRVISAQKAFTANAFSLPGLALSTANLYQAVQPGGSLYGLQHSNPVDTTAAYGGKSDAMGTANDPMVGKKVGGINVFGGGVALYNSQQELIGALGVSGDSSCADHNIAWKVRDTLALDFVPAGVSNSGDDNIVFQATAGSTAAGFVHPEAGGEERRIGERLPRSHPIGKVKGSPAPRVDPALKKAKEEIARLEKELSQMKQELAEARKPKAATKGQQKKGKTQKKNESNAPDNSKKKAVVSSEKPYRVMTFDRVSAVNYEARSKLVHDLKKELDQDPNIQILIVGHANDARYASVNLEISQNRASFLAQFLGRNGVPKNQISWKAIGNDQPDAAAEHNRRVEVFLQKAE